MTIGQLAKKVGVNPQTLRFYEREGLLPSPCRQGSGNYRDYDESALSSVDFIRSAKLAGFTLDNIKELLDARLEDEPCGNVENLVAGRLSELDQRIAELVEFRRRLSQLHNECKFNDSLQKCPAIDTFTGDSRKVVIGPLSLR